MTGPRIALLHALEESVAPSRLAFQQLWPQAYCFDLLDTSLAVDLVETGHLDDRIMRRFQTLADYASSTLGRGGKTAGILFTCSAFGPAIDAVKASMSIPVLRPNEAGFAEALDYGASIALVVTFAPSSRSLEAELHAMAHERGKPITIKSIVVDKALSALKAGNVELHDQLVAEAVAEQAANSDVTVLGQFSLARARIAIEARTSVPVITTPSSAVAAMRMLIKGPGSAADHHSKGALI